MISRTCGFLWFIKASGQDAYSRNGLFKGGWSFSYVNGQYVTPFTFDASTLSDNQSFTIAATDLFKAYCLNKEFRKVIDTGKFVLY